MRGLTYDLGTILAFALTIFVALLLPMGACVPAAASHTADDVLDVITHKAEPLYQLTVDDCHALEKAAAEINPLSEARREVSRIRGACNEAFAAWTLLIKAQQAAREANEAYRAGTLAVREMVAAAMAVDRAYRAAKTAAQELKP